MKDQINIAENFSSLNFVSYLEYTPLKVIFANVIFYQTIYL